MLALAYLLFLSVGRWVVINIQPLAVWIANPSSERLGEARTALMPGTSVLAGSGMCWSIRLDCC